MELIPWKATHGTYTIERTSLNLHHGSYLMEVRPWKIRSETYTMEVT